MKYLYIILCLTERVFRTAIGGGRWRGPLAGAKKAIGGAAFGVVFIVGWDDSMSEI